MSTPCTDHETSKKKERKKGGKGKKYGKKRRRRNEKIRKEIGGREDGTKDRKSVRGAPRSTQTRARERERESVDVHVRVYARETERPDRETEGSWFLMTRR